MEFVNECVSVIFHTQNKSGTTLIISKSCINHVFRDQTRSHWIFSIDLGNCIFGFFFIYLLFTLAFHWDGYLQFEVSPRSLVQLKKSFSPFTFTCFAVKPVCIPRVNLKHVVNHGFARPQKFFFGAVGSSYFRAVVPAQWQRSKKICEELFYNYNFLKLILIEFSLAAHYSNWSAHSNTNPHRKVNLEPCQTSMKEIFLWNLQKSFIVDVWQDLK